MTPAAAPPHRYAGWYRVLDAAALPRGAVRTVTLVGRERVVFRTTTGTVSAADPICPHLGAHLGHGGTVIGETLRCPFHGYRFGVDGACRAAEHVRATPSRTRLTTVPVREFEGQVFLWDGPAGEAPAFELPTLEHAGLTTPRYVTRRFEGRIEDFAENGVDVGHFGAVHQYERVRDLVIRHDGARLHSRFRFDRANPMGPLPRRITSVFDTVIHGLGCSVTELTVETLGMRMRLLLLATPTTPGVVEFTVGLALRAPAALDRLPRAALDHATAPLARFLLANVLADIEQDRAIWAHRVRLERPQLAPEDAEIARFRRWLVQFRDDAPGAAADGAA